MPWTNVVTNIISVLGLIIAAITGIWLKEKYDRIRETKEWFYTTYILHGISPLLSYLNSLTLEFSLPKKLSTEHFLEKSFPEKELQKIEDLLGQPTCRGIFIQSLCLTKALQELIHTKGVKIDIDFLETINGCIRLSKKNLYDLQQCCMSFEYKNQSHLFKLRDKPEIKKISEVFETLSERMHSLYWKEFKLNVSYEDEAKAFSIHPLE